MLVAHRISLVDKPWKIIHHQSLVLCCSSSSSSSTMLLLRTAISSPLSYIPHSPLSSANFYSQTQLGFHLPLHNRTNRNRRSISISCKYSRDVRWHPPGVSDGDRWRRVKKWKEIYQRIALMENPSLGVAVVLNQFDKHEKRITKWELYRCVKELRKFRKYELALEVHEWMKSQGDRYDFYSGDAAMQLDLISKVHGIYSAEEYFLDLPRSSRDKRTYGALLNAYVQAKLREKAEPLFENMRERILATNSLPFNAMLTLYMNLREYEKVITLITDMLAKRVKLNFWSYNIWITAHGALGSTDKMEQVLERMKMDRTVDISWATYTTLASIYIKLGQPEKAKECLKRAEYKITTRSRMPYHYLLSLYSLVGEKEDVYRIWKVYKSKFPSIFNLGYKAVIASLLKFDEVEGAENIYKEWLSVRTSYDPNICNLLIKWYVRKGLLEQAEVFVRQVLEEVVGGKVNADTWMLLAEGYIKGKNIPEALSCIKEATTADRADSWRPKTMTLSAFISVCEKESDLESKDELLEVLRKVGWSKDEKPMSLASTTNDFGIDFDSKLSMDTDMSDGDSDNNDDADADADVDDDDGTLSLASTTNGVGIDFDSKLSTDAGMSDGDIDNNDDGDDSDNDDDGTLSLASTTNGVGIDFDSKLSMDADMSDGDIDDVDDGDGDGDGDGDDDDEADDGDDDDDGRFLQVLDLLQGRLL